MKIKPFYSEGKLVGYSFICPGCKNCHEVYTEIRNHWGARWSFSGTLDKPTFSPSFHEKVGPYPEGAFIDGKDWSNKYFVCHFFIRKGKIEFLGDCTHGLVGKIVEMTEI